jgi:hypothetical protein
MAQHEPALPLFAAAGEVVAALLSCTQTMALPRVTKRPWLPFAAAGLGAVAVRVAGAKQQEAVWGAGGVCCAERATDGAAKAAAATNDKARVFLPRFMVFS